jgi:hypothetical protein
MRIEPCLVMLLGFALLGAGPASTSAPATKVTFRAPPGVVLGFDAAPGGKHALWRLRRQEPGLGKNPTEAIVLQDTTTGQVTPLWDLLGVEAKTTTFQGAAFSADGKQFLVRNTVKGLTGYHVYDLAGKRVAEVFRQPSDTLYASWAGTRVALHGNWRQMDVPVVLVDPFARTETKLDIHGRLMAASADGNVLVVLGIAGSAPATRPATDFARQARLHFLDATGHAIQPDRDASRMGQATALSPDGKLFVYSATKMETILTPGTPAGRITLPAKEGKMEIIPTAGGPSREVAVESVMLKFANSPWGDQAQMPVASMPVALTNVGTIVSMTPKLLRYTDRAGKTEPLLKDYAQVSIAGDVIYAIRTDRDEPEVSQLQIPER